MVTGASSGSFWHLNFSGRRAEGVSYLGNRPEVGRLPGDETLNTIIANLEALKRDYPLELEGIEPNEGLYVARQVWSWLRQRRKGAITSRELRERFRRLGWADVGRLARVPLQREPRAAARAALRAHLNRDNVIRSERFQPAPGVADIAEFARWLEAEERRGSLT
jgi:hypothetical protein